MNELFKFLQNANPAIPYTLLALLVIVIVALLSYIYIAIKMNKNVRIGWIEIGRPVKSDDKGIVTTHRENTPIIISSDSLLSGIETESVHFEQVITSVVLICWKDRSQNTIPIKTCDINCLNMRKKIDIFDETTVFVVKKLSDKSITQVPLTILSSGIVTFDPILPDYEKYKIDEASYKRKCSNITALVDLKEVRLLSYVTHRYNSFQPGNPEEINDMGNEDYRITQKNGRVDKMVLHISFEKVHGNCAFKELPKAIVEDGRSGNLIRIHKFDSQQGKCWTASLIPHNNDEALKITWKLCNGLPDNSIYVFAYASLMHPNSVRKTLNKDNSYNVELIPAKLNHYKKTWSSYKINREGYKSSEGNHIDYIAYINIEEDFNSQTLGVIIKVSKDELLKLDERESNYVRIDVTNNITLFDTEIEPDTTIFTYISLSNLAINDTRAIVAYRKDYLAIVKDACVSIDSKYFKDKQTYRKDFEKVSKNIRKWPFIETDNIKDEKRKLYDIQ